MKTILIALVVVGVMALAVIYGYPTETLKYVKSENLEVQEVQPEEIVQEDTIEKARKDLERINAELDAKEQDLLKQRESIDAELERLRETRVSFQ